ncbi:MAG: hypothetical protein KDK78_02385 [Chlamydiia bacterium]|nr:hypothetical protein [Chlamydiia bacterium]
MKSIHSTWQVGPELSDRDLELRLDSLQNQAKSYWLNNYQTLAHFLIIAQHYTSSSTLRQRISHLMEHLSKQLECCGCACAKRGNGDCARKERVRDALLSALNSEASFEGRAEHRGWVPSDLRSRTDVVNLLEDIDALMQSKHLDCEDFPYLPQPVKNALCHPELRESFGGDVLENPSLRGHLVDLYRGCRDCVVAEP